VPAGSGAGGVPPTGRVVLFGATGYTGALVARAMARRGMRPVLAGRRRSALEELAAELGGLDTAVADAADPPSVRGLVDAGDVLVSTVGPFARWGEAALEAALDAGAHYLDSSGEPAFIRRVFERAGPRAERLGVLLLPAMAQDWVPRAIAGALAMRDAAQRTGTDLGYGVGVHTGEAMVGNLGSDEYQNFTAIGDTVNVAARLQGQAKAGEVICSAAVLAAAGDGVRVTPLGALELKGRRTPVEAYRVDGLS